jgi:hypothetical protein
MLARSSTTLPPTPDPIIENQQSRIVKGGLIDSRVFPGWGPPLL